MKLFTEYVAVDLGTFSVKFFSVNPNAEGYSVSDMFWEVLPPGLVSGGFTNPSIKPVSKLTELLHRQLDRLKSHKSGFIVGLPDRWVKLHLVEIKLKPHEAESPDYLSWRLRKLLPLPTGVDLIVDHQILSMSQAEDGLECKILAGVVRRDIIDTISLVFSELRAEVMAFDTSSLGVYNLMEDAHPENSLGLQMIMCHIGHETTVVKIYQSGLLIYERVIEVGGEEFGKLFSECEGIPPDQAQIFKTKRKFFPTTKAEFLSAIPQKNLLEKVFGNWLRELNVTFRFYQDKFKVIRLPRIYLTGGSSLFEGLPEFLSEYFETVCERFNPLVDIPSPSRVDPKDQVSGSMFAPSIGLLAR